MIDNCVKGRHLGNSQSSLAKQEISAIAILMATARIE
jgi:hypothetical protein